MVLLRRGDRVGLFQGKRHTRVRLSLPSLRQSIPHASNAEPSHPQASRNDQHNRPYRETCTALADDGKHPSDGNAVEVGHAVITTLVAFLSTLVAILAVSPTPGASQQQQG